MALRRWRLRLLVLCLLALACMEKNTACVPGDPEAFDVVANYAAVHQYAGEQTALVKITAHKVETDGTLNLEAPYKPRAVYRFVRPATKAEEVEKKPRKIGTGMAPAKTPQPGPYEAVSVTIRDTHRTSTTINNTTQVDRVHGGMARRVHNTYSAQKPTTIPRPGCSFATLWRTAIAQGVPRNAVAEISYGETGYRFAIEEINVDLSFDRECTLRPRR